MMNPMISPVPSHPILRRYLPALRYGLAALALLPLAASAGPNDPVTLRMKFKAGETSDYQVSMQYTVNMPGLSQAKPSGDVKPPSANGMTQDLSMFQHSKVTKALPNGNGEVEVTVTDATGKGATAKPITMVYDPLGNVVSMNMPGSQGGGPTASMFGALGNPGISNTQGTFLPSKAVKPGDTWTQSIKLPGYTGNGTVTVKYVKRNTVGRYQTAFLQSTMTLPINFSLDSSGKPATDPSKAIVISSGTLKMTYDNDFAIAEGKLIRSSSNGVMDMTMITKGGKSPNGGTSAQPQKIAMSIKITSTASILQK